MKIVFDNIIFSLQRCGGISVVWGKLLHYILPKGDEITLLEYRHAEQNIIRHDLKTSHTTQIQHPHYLMKLRRLIDIPGFMLRKQKEPFIFHSSYYRLCHHPKAIQITTVHDFGYYLYVRNPLLRFIHCRQQFRAIRKADYVVCISESTRCDLHRFLPDVPREKTRVIHNGVSEAFHILPDVQHEDFALFVGKRDRYKNFDSLIEPLGRLGKRLVIVGNPLTSQEKEELAVHRVRYEHIDFVNEEQLNHLYNRADCLLYTSSYEGFGLPILEAQLAGCPVIAMNTSSIPEVIGDHSLLLDEISEDTLRPLFARIANPEQRKEIIENGKKNAARFSWEKMANQYYELYKEAILHKQS